jgi:hypothetical protein
VKRSRLGVSRSRRTRKNKGNIVLFIQFFFEYYRTIFFI